jgi:hypothetical protein
MNLTLKRMESTELGVFGVLAETFGRDIAVTLEHAYDSGNGDGSYIPKVPPGRYTCVKGMHRLAHSKAPFETFEIMNVPNHTKILFHVGNWNKDSNGCVLLGIDRVGADMIAHSRKAFDAFMKLQENNNEFTLTVV